MSWSSGVITSTQSPTKRAKHKTLLAKHTLSKCSSGIKTKAYCTLVRSTLEYAVTVWDPHQQYLIDEIERVL